MIKEITTDIYKNTNIDYIYHLADIHIPNDNARHNEYREVFKVLYTKLKKNKNKTNPLIVIAGDIIDKGDKITPDCIKLVKEFFLNLSNIFPTVIIAGNHDDNVRGNDTKTDAITAILKDNQYKNLHYLNETAIFNLGTNISMGIITVFNETLIKSNEFPINNRLKIGVYHGMVESLAKEQNHNIPSGDYKFTSNDFNGYDIVLLGDIHKFYYLNNEKTIAYCGSLIQQSHGEHLTNHGGCIKWNLNNKTSDFINIHNDYGFITVNYKDTKLEIPDIYPKKSRIRVKYLDTDYIDNKNISDKLKIYMPNTEIEALKIDYCSKSSSQQIFNYINDDDLFSQYIDTNNFSDTKKQTIIQIHNNFINDLSSNDIQSKSIWKIKNLSFKNMLCYKTQQYIDFDKLISKDSLWGILGKNAQGKSSVLKILLFSLFGKIPNTPKNDIVNKSSKNKTISTQIEFSILDINYKIKRTLSSVKLFKIINSKDIDISEAHKIDTENKISNIIGDIDVLLNTNISLQEQHNNLINLSNVEQMKVLKKILSLDSYDKIYKKVKNKVKDLKNEYDKLHLDVENDNQIIITKTENNLALTNLKVEKNELDLLIKNDNKKQEFIKLSKKNNKLIETITKLNDTKLNDTKLNDTKLNDTQFNLAEIESELLNSKNKITKLENKKDSLLSNISPIDPKFINFNNNNKDIQLFTTKKENLINDLNNLVIYDKKLLQQELSELSKSLKPENLSDLYDINKETTKLNKNKLDYTNLLIDYQKLSDFLETNSKINSEEIKNNYLSYKNLINKLSKLNLDFENITHNYKNKLNLLNKDTFKYNNTCQECQYNKTCSGITKLEEDSNELSIKIDLINLNIKNLAGEIESKKGIEIEYDLLNNLEKEIEIKTKQYDKLDIKIEKLKFNMEKLELSITNFNTNQINIEYNQTIKIKIKEIETKLNDIIKSNTITVEIDKIQIKIEKLLNLKQNYEKVEETIINNKQYETELTITKKELSSEKINYKNLDTKLNDYHKNLEFITKSKQDLENLAIEIEILNYNSELDNKNLKNRIEKVCGKLGILENDLNKIQLLETTIVHKTIKLSNIQNDLDNYQSYENIINWSGYPIFLIKKKLDILEIQINRILSIGAHFKCKVVLNEDNLIFYSIINDKQVPIKNCSGYEKFILSIAIRMGLITISNYMTPNFFIIDEGFGTMDHNNQQNIEDLFDNLKRQFELIFVITHIEELKQKIENKLVIDNYKIK